MSAFRDAVISFPMFGEHFALNPPASFVIFGHTFYFYGLIIAVGVILALLFCGREAPRLGLSDADFYDLMIWAIPLSVIAARLYSLHPGEIVKIWEGGLAIYGAVIGGVLTLLLFCRAKKKNAGSMADLAAFGLLIGQCIGRWGNFMNREAFGYTTDAPWRMGLTLPGTETIYVHPTFLYESLWNLLGFIILYTFLRRGKRRFNGQIFLMYAAWYGLGRSFIEGLRADSLYIAGTGIRISQLVGALSAALAAAAILLLARRSRAKAELNAGGPEPSEAEAESVPDAGGAWPDGPDRLPDEDVGTAPPVGGETAGEADAAPSSADAGDPAAPPVSGTEDAESGGKEAMDKP